MAQPRNMWVASKGEMSAGVVTLVGSSPRKPAVASGGNREPKAEGTQDLGDLGHALGTGDIA